MSSYTPNFSVKRMKIYPPLSESIRYVQGRNVRSDYFADRFLPVAGRGPTKLYYNSADGKQTTNISDQNFFDDSIVGKLSISGKKSTADISSDAGFIKSVFSYDLSGYTYGMTDNDPLPNYPWIDKNKFDPVKYLNDPNYFSEFIVNDDPSAIDELNYNGVIEPFSIRSFVTMNSTFVGDVFDPEPHSIKAGMAGQYAEESYFRFNLITNYFQRTDSNKNQAFKFCVDYNLFEGFSNYIPDYSYVISETSYLNPFTENHIEEIQYRDIRDDKIQNILVASSSNSSFLYDMPTKDSITRPCGFVYENNSFGTDSLAFGGLLK